MSQLFFFFFKNRVIWENMSERESWLTPSAHTLRRAHTSTMEGPDRAEELTAALKVGVKKGRSSPENIPEFSPRCNTTV